MCEAKNLSKKVGQGAMNLFEQVIIWGGNKTGE